MCAVYAVRYCNCDASIYVCLYVRMKVRKPQKFEMISFIANALCKQMRIEIYIHSTHMYAFDGYVAAAYCSECEAHFSKTSGYF